MALFVGLNDPAVQIGRVLGCPGEKSGTKIEADSGIVVQNVRNALLAIENASGQVGSVALGRHALIPVMVGIGRILKFNLLEPRILAWRLIEMTVNTKIVHS